MQRAGRWNGVTLGVTLPAPHRTRNLWFFFKIFSKIDGIIMATPVENIYQKYLKIGKVSKTALSTQWRASRAIFACLFWCVFFRAIWTTVQLEAQAS